MIVISRDGNIDVAVIPTTTVSLSSSFLSSVAEIPSIGSSSVSLEEDDDTE